MWIMRASGLAATCSCILLGVARLEVGENTSFIGAGPGLGGLLLTPVGLDLRCSLLGLGRGESLVPSGDDTMADIL